MAHTCMLWAELQDPDLHQPTSTPVVPPTNLSPRTNTPLPPPHLPPHCLTPPSLPTHLQVQDDNGSYVRRYWHVHPVIRSGPLHLEPHLGCHRLGAAEPAWEKDVCVCVGVRGGWRREEGVLGGKMACPSTALRRTWFKTGFIQAHPGNTEPANGCAARLRGR
jgi:hypothetical protein